MSNSVISHVVLVGLLATAIMPSANTATRAAADCLAEPNHAPAPGGHWYYRLDRVNDRKCWYLVEPASQAPSQTPMAEEPPPAAVAPPQPTFGSFFSTLSTGFPGSTVATPADPGGDMRALQTGPADDLKGDGAATTGQPRMLRRPELQAAPTPKPHRPAHVQLRSEQAAERPAGPLNQAERDALFQEFLRWRDRRTAQP